MGNISYKKSVDALFDILGDELKEGYQSKLEPFDQHLNKLKLNFIENVEKRKEKINKGYNLIVNRLKEKEQDFDINKFLINEEKMENVKEYKITEALIDPSQTFQAKLEISNDSLLEMVEVAYDLIANEELEDAHDALCFLVWLNPSIKEFWKKLGLILEMQEDFEDAVNCYLTACITEPYDLQSEDFVDVARCFLVLDKLEEAEQVFKSGIEIADKLNENPNAEKIKEDCEELIYTLQQ